MVLKRRERAYALRSALVEEEQGASQSVPWARWLRSSGRRDSRAQGADCSACRRLGSEAQRRRGPPRRPERDPDRTATAGDDDWGSAIERRRARARS